ncbi:hypothetical protein D3C84_601060 [compost metagenome]
MERVSTSFGFKNEISLVKTPSTTYNILSEVELTPLIFILGEPPAFPELVTCTPATLPWSELTTLPLGCFAITSDLMTATLPVKSAFFAVPYPIITTASSSFAF